ncbi:MAG: LysE family translocator [Alphaproteobacteria bacterium]|nr:LysE family translocator [Alphaproteobacteria bacterium]MDX5368209.1 LysE family translocator [Alphaproteobacteria bacterium]MDX5463021.1 LysE family translocator [Alphaproteobacteria bacterium]
MLINGAVIGVIVAAPIGPVNLVCIQRTIQHGRLNGLLAGMGAVAADAVFATLAAFGLVAASDLVGGLGAGIQILGALFLVILGVRTILKARPRGITADVAEGARAGLWQAPALTFLLTITNPMTLLGFIAIFAGAGGLVGTHVDTVEALLLIAGVAAGSAGWWLALTGVVGTVRSRFTDGWVMRLNQFSGLCILAFGAWLLYRIAAAGGLPVA